MKTEKPGVRAIDEADVWKVIAGRAEGPALEETVNWSCP